MGGMGGGLIVGGRLWLEGHWWILKFGGCWVLNRRWLVISIHHPAEMATSSISAPLSGIGGMVNGGVELMTSLAGTSCYFCCFPHRSCHRGPQGSETGLENILDTFSFCY